MFKLLLCSVFFAPLIVLPLSASTDREISSQSADFDSVYVDPELEKIDACENADLDIFFHEEFITTHSADYLNDGLNRLSDCATGDVAIQPILSANATTFDEDLLKVQISELELILEAHDYDANVLPLKTLKSVDAFSLNGRAAIVKFSTSDFPAS